MRSAYERGLQKLTSVVGDVPMDEDRIITGEQARREAVADGQRSHGLSTNEWVSFM